MYKTEVGKQDKEELEDNIEKKHLILEENCVLKEKLKTKEWTSDKAKQ